MRFLSAVDFAPVFGEKSMNRRDVNGGRGKGERRTGALDVEVVDVEFSVRVRAAGSLEREGDVGRVQRVVEDVRSERPIVIERFCKTTVSQILAVAYEIRLPLIISQESRGRK